MSTRIEKRNLDYVNNNKPKGGVDVKIRN